MDGQGWRGLTAAAVLIRAIPAVVCPVTHPQLGDAAVVVALELHRVAELVWERRRGGVRARVMLGKDVAAEPRHCTDRRSGRRAGMGMFPSS